MQYGPKMIIVILAGIATFATCRLAFAGERLTTVTTEAVSSFFPDDKDFDEDASSGGSVNSSANAAAGPAALGLATATAGFKKVKVFTKGQKTDPIFGGRGHADASAASTEVMTFFTPERPFLELIDVEIAFNVDGSISGGASCPSGQAAYSADASLAFYSDGFYHQISFGDIDNTPGVDDLLETGTATFITSWPNGQTYNTIMHALVSSLAVGIGDCTANAECNIGNTFTWMGVVSVKDTQGNTITNYALTDEHGNDWSTPASPADVTSDGVVNVDDLLAVISSWGDCPDFAGKCNSSTTCAADIAPLVAGGDPSQSGDCTVNVDDLLLVVTLWSS